MRVPARALVAVALIAAGAIGRPALAQSAASGDLTNIWKAAAGSGAKKSDAPVAKAKVDSSGKNKADAPAPKKAVEAPAPKPTVDSVDVRARALSAAVREREDTIAALRARLAAGAPAAPASPAAVKPAIAPPAPAAQAVAPAAAKPAVVPAASAPPAAAPVTLPTIDFSGLMFGHFRYTYDDATKAANGGNATNKFDVERVYLTFKMPAGNDGSIRVTTDIFNNSISGSSCVGCYAGWNVRFKYAYFQYNFLHDIGSQPGFNAVARVGMLHTSIIDLEESFWPRYISLTAVERNSFFSSSDVGVAGLLTLPKKWGEFYATVTNGMGYSAVEADPYKDYSARLSLTPFGRQDGIMKTFTVAPYIYLGKTASKFLTTAGSAGTPAADGLAKNRAGVFVGVKDRKLTAGADWAQRTETVETGSTLATRGSYDNTGTLTGAFVLARPFELFSGDPKAKSPFGVLARVDKFKPYSDQRSAGPTTATQTPSSANQLLIAGLFWDITSKATFSFDFQHVTPQAGSTTAESKILFAHMQVVF